MKINKDFLNKKTYTDFAENYANKFMKLNQYNDSYDFFCENLSDTSKILEVACGPGNITQYIKKKLPNSEYLATDYAEKMLEIASKNANDISTKLLDVRDLPILFPEKYNAVIAGFVLPYLEKLDAENLFKNISELLDTKGKLYISTMQGNYENSRQEKTSFGGEVFIHYYPKNFLLSLAEQNDLVLIKEYALDYTENNGSITTDMIFIFEKK